MDNIRNRITELLEEMQKGAFEREEIIGLSLLSALAGESIFMLGLPGVGKSMVARRLKMAFSGSTCFEYLMSRFSTPDEIFGPVSISKLKDDDTYERCIDGYLPTADIVFLDEIWKAGPAIQNALLTVLNEKIFRNGRQDMRLPLKAVISASNELPAEGEGLEALWDRFLLRSIVSPIRARSRFLDLILDRGEECIIPERLRIQPHEFGELRQQSRDIRVPEDVTEVICSIHDALAEAARKAAEGEMDGNKDELVEPPYVSDRRWKKIIGLLRTSALLNGRDSVDLSDCLLLEHMLWDKDEQLHAVRKLIAKALITYLRDHNVTSIMNHPGTRSHYTEPVGEPVSPDGVHYVFSAGDEEIMISKEDYARLSDNALNGLLGDDNILRITEDASSFTIRSLRPGMITLNSFSYPLKRKNALRTGSVKGLVETMHKDTDAVRSLLKTMVDDNIFLRGFSSYRELQTVFSDIKAKVSKLEF